MSNASDLIEKAIMSPNPETRRNALSHWLSLYRSEVFEESSKKIEEIERRHSETVQQLTNVISKLTTLVIQNAHTEPKEPQ